jgi:uncharacterized integral membrane protein
MTNTELTPKDVARVKSLQSVRVFLLAIVLAASAVLIAKNTGHLRVDWLFGTDRVSLALPLAIAWGAGFVAGVLVMWHAGARIVRRAGYGAVELDDVAAERSEDRAVHGRPGTFVAG